MSISPRNPELIMPSPEQTIVAMRISNFSLSCAAILPGVPRGRWKLKWGMVLPENNGRPMDGTGINLLGIDLRTIRIGVGHEDEFIGIEFNIICRCQDWFETNTKCRCWSSACLATLFNPAIDHLLQRTPWPHPFRWSTVQSKLDWLIELGIPAPSHVKLNIVGTKRVPGWTSTTLAVSLGKIFNHRLEVGMFDPQGIDPLFTVVVIGGLPSCTEEADRFGKVSLLVERSALGHGLPEP